MNDLVKRLRESAQIEYKSGHPVAGEELDEAADKIDFLEAALKAAIADIDYLRAENERLRLTCDGLSRKVEIEIGRRIASDETIGLQHEQLANKTDEIERLKKQQDVDITIHDTFACWEATRIKGRSASMSCDGHVNIALLKLFDKAFELKGD